MLDSDEETRAVPCGFGSDDSTSTELREREPVSIRPSTLASSSVVGVALVMNATTQEMVNPTMVDLTVLDSASEVDDHVHGGSGDCFTETTGN